jgi:Cft2 family RNA processing exonuclease
MRIVPLGGAEEIGASCTFVHIGGRRLIVDCGIRTGSGASDPLPNLSALADLGGVDAILVTHAHLDHTGALPVLHQAFPAAPVYATPATHALIRVMLGDALKVMASRWERESEVPLYSAEAVSSLLSRAVPVNFVQPTPILGGDVAVTFFPAGHVLGAAMIGIEARDGSVLFTGDYSVSPQRTVEGLLAPRFQADVLVTESTYGDRLHANRAVEERKLAEKVANVVEGGGKALVPAFALGRAQEVLLILAQFMRDKAIPRFPIHVDGMVKNICGVYTSQSEALARDLRRRLQREGQLFFKDAEPVSPPQRDSIVSGPPCAIVSSSGMLTGGPSLFYARRLAPDARSAILITGYQDEESPGRKLLDLAEAKDRTLTVEGQAIPVECKVEKYGLSAHADSGEMAGLASRVRPREVVLVHGAGEARERLAGLMPGHVHLPSACDELVFEKPARGRSIVVEAVPGMGGGRPLDDRGLEILKDRLVAEGRGTAMFTVADLAMRWYGTRATPEEVEHTREVLALGSRHFTPDSRRPFMFRPAREEAGAPPEAFPVDQARAMTLAAEAFGDVPDLYKKGAYPEERRLVLYFSFPAVAEKRHAERIQALGERTGWQVEIWPEVHLGTLMTIVEEILPANWRLVKTPSYYRDERRVKVRVEAPPEADLDAPARDFLERTGVELMVERAGLGTALPAVAKRSDGKLEINTAYAVVERHLGPTGLRKRGLKNDAGGQYIELTWLSPAVGERHAALVDEVEREVGWRLKINPRANQNAIKEAARRLAPASWGVTKDPAFLETERRLRMKAAGPVDPGEVAEVSRRLEEETGYTLEVE